MTRLVTHFHRFLPNYPGRPDAVCRALCLLALVPGLAWAQDMAASAPTTQSQSEAPRKRPTPAAASLTAQVASTSNSSGLANLYRWKSLTAAQRHVLAPLEDDWAEIDQQRRRKWLEIASRFQSLPADEQARMQERMSSWSKLSPSERSQARLLFQQAQQFAPQSRQEKWEAYQALAPEQRQELADKAAKRRGVNNAPPYKGAPLPTKPGLADRVKSNLVPDRSHVPLPAPVAPTLVQNKPGATTTLINQAAAPPAHQQGGQTKILAVPDLVNPATLLPRRAAASAPNGIPSNTPARQ